MTLNICPIALFTVFSQFDTKWLHPTTHPTVVAIYWILVPGHVFDAYKLYWYAHNMVTSGEQPLSTEIYRDKISL